MVQKINGYPPHDVQIASGTKFAIISRRDLSAKDIHKAYLTYSTLPERADVLYVSGEHVTFDKRVLLPACDTPAEYGMTFNRIIKTLRELYH